MENKFLKVASLIGDPVRATILWTLLDGKAFTATELSIAADTSPQNISMHLNKLVQSQLLCVESQGRHKYYRYAGKEIAYAVEALANLIPFDNSKPKSINENISPVKYCRSCYDHLAGKIGVAVADSLLKQKIIINNNNAFELSKKGEKWFNDLEIIVDDLKYQRRSFLRPCLDWSERRYHIAGSLAASLFDKMLASGWLRKTKNSRAIIITGEGQKKMYEHFKLRI